MWRVAGALNLGADIKLAAMFSAMTCMANAMSAENLLAMICAVLTDWIKGAPWQT
jgi:hypothetical protein